MSPAPGHRSPSRSCSSRQTLQAVSLWSCLPPTPENRHIWGEGTGHECVCTCVHERRAAPGSQEPTLHLAPCLSLLSAPRGLQRTGV